MAALPRLVRPLTRARAPWLRAAPIGLAALVLAGCASGPAVVRAPSPDRAPRPETPREGDATGPVERGTASWYGRPHHGRRTASGETYDMNALTAAHPSLPLGTRVLVTNANNGRSVRVRINDRGPIVPGRIIDLSYAAARQLGAVSDGTIPVVVRVLSSPTSELGPAILADVDAACHALLGLPDTVGLPGAPPVSGAPHRRADRDRGDRQLVNGAEPDPTDGALDPQRDFLALVNRRRPPAA